MQKEIFLKKLGAHIKKLRKEKKLSQGELANIIDKEGQSLQRVEAGNINPTIVYLAEVAKGLNVSLKELLDFEVEL